MPSDPREVLRRRVAEMDRTLALMLIATSAQTGPAPGVARIKRDTLTEIRELLAALSAQPSGEPVSGAYQLPSGDGERNHDALRAGIGLEDLLTLAWSSLFATLDAIRERRAATAPDATESRDGK